MEFLPATRQGVKPIIALAGESNAGKTMSALILARGLAGPSGIIVCVDTENMRAGLYADQIPGGFLHGDLQPPFTPQRHIDALDAAEAAGAAVIVLDSFSHEWEGEGGVLDMAAENEEKSGKPGLHVWRKPKMDHKQLILRLQRGKVPVILCLRSMFKSRQEKDDRGKPVILKDPFLTPVQSPGFIFDATVILEMQRASPGHFYLAKWSVPQLQECFPGCGPKNLSPSMVTIEHGVALARWCAGKPVKEPPDPLKAAKTKLWGAVKGDFKDLEEFQTWLHAHDLMSLTQKLSELNAPALEQLYNRVGAFYVANPKNQPPPAPTA